MKIILEKKEIKKIRKHWIDAVSKRIMALPDNDIEDMVNAKIGLEVYISSSFKNFWDKKHD